MGFFAWLFGKRPAEDTFNVEVLDMTENYEIIGWAIEKNPDLGTRPWIKPITRYTDTAYAPSRDDGSDKDGDFWSNNVCIGCLGEHFEWTDPPGFDGYAAPSLVLKTLVAMGKITEEDITAAYTAQRLLGNTSIELHPPTQRTE